MPTVIEPFGPNSPTRAAVAKKFASEPDVMYIVTWRDEFGNSYFQPFVFSNDGRCYEEEFFDHIRKFGIAEPAGKSHCEIWITNAAGENGEFDVSWHEFTYWPYD